VDCPVAIEVHGWGRGRFGNIEEGSGVRLCSAPQPFAPEVQERLKQALLLPLKGLHALRQASVFETLR
jgi:hypothetical protein